MNTIRDRLKFSNKESIHAGMAFSMPFLFNFFLINTIWTPTQGWYLEWASYVNKGLNPYTDFYIPFPPFFVWINRIFLWTSDPFIAERIFMTIAYSLLSLGLYQLLSRFFSSGISISASLLSILIFQLSPTNTISGYYEFAMLLATWGLYFSFSEGSKKRYFGGVLLATSCLTKQNFLLLIPAVALMESFTFESKKNYGVKRYATTFGAFSALLAFTGYLVSESSLLRFLEIMLQGGGKDPEILSSLKNLIAPALNPSLLYLFCLILLTNTMIKVKSTAENRFIAIFLATQMVILVLNPFSISSLIESRVSIIIFGVVFLAIFFNWKFLNQLIVSSKSWLIIVIIYMTPFLVFVMNEIFLRSALNQNTFFQKLNNYSSNVGLKISGLLLLIMITFVLFQISAIWYPEVKQYIHQCFRNEIDQPRLLAKLNYVVFGLLATGLLNAVNGGFDFAANLILGSISIAFFVKHFEKTLTKGVFIIPIALSLLLSSIQIGIHNYQWFGWNEVASGHSTSNRSELGIFRNFYLTNPQRNFYQEISSGLDLAEQKIAKSTDVAPEILVFPMQPVISELSLLKKYRVNCPIMHFDICPDNEAEKDFKNFKMNPPDLVVLFDLGMDFIDINEKAWRDGKISTYRRIQEFFLESGLYSKVKIVRSNSVNLSDVYILVLKSKRDQNE